MDSKPEQEGTSSGHRDLLENPMLKTRLLVHLELGEQRDFKKFDAAMNLLLQNIEKAVSQHFEQNPSFQRPACHSGCHWCCGYCCGYKISVFPFEVVRIVTFLQDSLSANEMKKLRDRIEKTSKARPTHLSPKKRVKLRFFCPLLIERRCIAYPIRPMSCRAHLSTDAMACKRAFYNPDNDRINLCRYALELYTNVKAGLRQGLHDFGIDSQPLELISALRHGFQVPDLMKIIYQ